MKVETTDLRTVQSAADLVSKSRQNLQQRIAAKTIPFIEIDGKQFIDINVLKAEYPEAFPDDPAS